MIDINTPQSAIVVCEEKSPFPEYRPVKVSSLENLWVSLMELRKDNWTKPEMLRVWIKLDTECENYHQGHGSLSGSYGPGPAIPPPVSSPQNFNGITRPADTAPLSDVIPTSRLK